MDESGSSEASTDDEVSVIFDSAHEDEDNESQQEIGNEEAIDASLLDDITNEYASPLNIGEVENEYVSPILFSSLTH